MDDSTHWKVQLGYIFDVCFDSYFSWINFQSHKLLSAALTKTIFVPSGEIAQSPLAILNGSEAGVRRRMLPVAVSYSSKAWLGASISKGAITRCELSRHCAVP